MAVARSSLLFDCAGTRREIKAGEVVGFIFTFCEGTADGGGAVGGPSQTFRADRAEAGLRRPQANWYETSDRCETHWRF